MDIRRRRKTPAPFSFQPAVISHGNCNYRLPEAEARRRMERAH
jgi:hypothetical protein